MDLFNQSFILYQNLQNYIFKRTKKVRTIVLCYSFFVYYLNFCQTKILISFIYIIIQKQHVKSVKKKIVI